MEKQFDFFLSMNFLTYLHMNVLSIFCFRWSVWAGDAGNEWYLFFFLVGKKVVVTSEEFSGFVKFLFPKNSTQVKVPKNKRNFLCS
jgi:hypothetical protein